MSRVLGQTTVPLPAGERAVSHILGETAVPPEAGDRA